VGAFSLIFNPFLIISVLAVVNAVVVTAALLRDDWYRQRMGGRFALAGVCCLLGGVLGALPAVFLLHTALDMARA
jgi:presenilin-like A22 family membrane protease